MLRIGDGQINFDEFCAMMGNGFETREQTNEMMKAFQAFDSNGDGYITREELRDVMRNVGDMLSDAELDAMMKQADLDKDGRVDFTEFVQMMKQQ